MVSRLVYEPTSKKRNLDRVTHLGVPTVLVAQVWFGKRATSLVKGISMRIVCLFVIIASLGFGCANEASDAGVTASECVQNDLVGQCPPNTTAQLSADSEAVCNQSTSVSVDGLLSSGEGEVSNVCVGAGSCKLVCELIAPCMFGVERVSPTDGVICYIPDGGCGDGECEAGETPQDCPQDCATDCEPNSARCSNGQLERCSASGEREEPVTCEDGQRCEESEDGSSASCVATDCGDGVVTSPEECDDGNEVNNDECTNQCTVPRCGDGIINGSEECDEGDDVNSDEVADTCRANCTEPVCGDGVKDVMRGEACDDGNLDNGDECTDECVLATCGDGIVDGNEGCDDGLNNSDDTPDACRANCTNPRCGDGIIDPTNNEACDNGDANTLYCEYGDMSCSVCNHDCEEAAGQVSYCGDGTEQEGEGCDDGNQATENCPYGEERCTVCNATCDTVDGATSFCGDGVEQERSGEACDDGPLNGDNNTCTDSCEIATCGDGFHLTSIENTNADAFEYCDDGNDINVEDGCNESCELTERLEANQPNGCMSNSGPCPINPGRILNGNCLLQRCYYTNPLPLYGAENTSQRSGFIHGNLAYVPNTNSSDTDVFGFEQTCGYPDLDSHRGTDCTGANSAVYYFEVDYDIVNAEEPFIVKQDCNGVSGGGEEPSCVRNLANFCDDDDNRQVCNDLPAGKNRAYWCSVAGRVGDYRIWLQNTAGASMDYTLRVREKVGTSNCSYLTLVGPGGGFPGGGIPGGGIPGHAP